jgi:hypothetical protein
MVSQHEGGQSTVDNALNEQLHGDPPFFRADSCGGKRCRCVGSRGGEEEGEEDRTDGEEQDEEETGERLNPWEESELEISNQTARGGMPCCDGCRLRGAERK